MERIDQQRRGETPPALTLLPAVWEGEVGGKGTKEEPEFEA
jgi:hypothetical protein